MDLRQYLNFLSVWFLSTLVILVIKIFFFSISFVKQLLLCVTGWSAGRATHGLHTVGHRCAVGVLAGTHRCDDSSRQDDESPERQPYSAALNWASAALHWAGAVLSIAVIWLARLIQHDKFQSNKMWLEIWDQSLVKEIHPKAIIFWRYEDDEITIYEKKWKERFNEKYSSCHEG